MIYKGTRQSPFLLFTMDPEIQALIAVYQKRLGDVTAQAIAFEARIIRLQQQIEELTGQSPEPTIQQVPPKKIAKKATVSSKDAGEF